MTAPRFSIVILTYARDDVLAEVLARLRSVLGGGEDYEVVLVDNNPERGARDAMLAPFPHRQYLFEGGNKGVSARNDGYALARGDIILSLDDDVFVETPDMFAILAARFDADPTLGVVTIAKHVRGDTRRRVDLIPHTRKDVDLTRPFPTFRFVGGLVAFRASMLREVGGYLGDFFYGLEEIELSYRIVDAGWRILYDPAITAEELEHQAGRKPMRQVQTDRLANKYIISYLRMPSPEIFANVLLFTPYLALRARGQVSVAGAIGQFLRWLRKPGRIRRKPISRATAAYIRACGGSVWR